jgi:hypothetical protein
MQVTPSFLTSALDGAEVSFMPQPLFPTQKEYPLPIKQESTWLPSWSACFEEEINLFPLLKFATKTFQPAGELQY